MTPVAAVGTGWSFQPQVMVLVMGTGGLYLYGLRLARLRRPGFRWSGRRTGSFVGGITALMVALGSPVEEYAHRLLSVHMVQHLVLMQVAPPLLLLGRPVTLLLAASPSTVRARVSGFAHGRMSGAVGSPVVGFGAFAVVLWAFHFTPLYEATLTREALHALEHAAFLAAALLFWWPIVGRDPGATRLSHPGRLLYLFLSMPVMSLLGFVITSSDRVLYPHYVATSRALGLPALADQRLGGTIMWESSMIVSAIALSAVLFDWMHRDEQEAIRADLRRASRPRPAAANVEAK